MPSKRETTESGQSQQQTIDNYENAVFISYAWGGESEHIVDELEHSFSKRNIRIVRDKKDISYKGSIEAFKQRIGQKPFIIIIISDKYLRSEYCMSEFIEIDKNRTLRERVFPIVLPDANIYEPSGRLTYIKYWDEKIEQLNQAVKQINSTTNLSGITSGLDKYAAIRNSIEHLTNLIRDMNVLTPNVQSTSDFSILVSAVERMIRKTNKGGGAYIGGNVSTSGGDFVGRDKIVRSGERSIAIGGNVSGSTIITGNGNIVNNFSSSDDLAKLLQQIQTTLNNSDLDTDVLDEIKSDLAKVQEQIIKPEPNKEIILKRLKSSLDYVDLMTTAVPLIELLRKSIAIASQMVGGNK